MFFQSLLKFYEKVAFRVFIAEQKNSKKIEIENKTTEQSTSATFLMFALNLSDNF